MNNRAAASTLDLFPDEALRPANRVSVYDVAIAPDVEALLAAGAPVAIGVSGGKDSAAAAFATVEHLDRIGHAGPRVLVHSDLGRVEWRDSLPACRRLADALGLELIVVRRKAGDLMDRWLVRWDNNVARYRDLETVKLILPWSTASMRFCTSELKTAVICSELTKRFPGQGIVSVNGIRRDESPNRRKAPISAPQKRLTSATQRTWGVDWHPIIEWSKADVLAYLAARGHALHEAYTVYGSSRVSCAFCILGSLADLAASSACPDNQDVYREMVELEIASTFSFQDSRWLGDVAPHLLDADARSRLVGAKERAARREAAEARIPGHLLYTQSWPTCVPSNAEARLLCEVRAAVAEAVGISVRYTDPDSVRARYEELIRLKEEKERAGTRRVAKPRPVPVSLPVADDVTLRVAGDVPAFAAGWRM